ALVEKSLEYPALLARPPLNLFEQAGGFTKLHLTGAGIGKRILHLAPGLQAFMGIAVKPDFFSRRFRPGFHSCNFLWRCHTAALSHLSLLSAALPEGEPSRALRTREF